MIIAVMQIIGILIPLFGIATLMRRKSQSMLSLRLILANMGCMVMNCGYLMFVIAQDDSAARMAIKFEYAGTVLFYLCFLFFLFAYMHMRTPLFPMLIWGIAEAATVGVFWFDDLRVRYFGDYAISTEKTFNIFTAQVNPRLLYYIQYGLLALIMILFFFNTVRYLFTVKLKAELMSMLRLSIAQLIITGALLFQLIKKPAIDVIPFASSAAMLFVVISLMNDNFFGITEKGRAWVFDQMGDAYVIVDRLYGFLDANHPAKRLFPMLKITKNGQGVPQDIISFFHYKGDENEVRLIRGNQAEGHRHGLRAPAERYHHAVQLQRAPATRGGTQDAAYPRGAEFDYHRSCKRRGQPR